jgi:hypothetical protein
MLTHIVEKECCKGCTFYQEFTEDDDMASMMGCNNPAISEEWCLDPNRPSIKGIYFEEKQLKPIRYEDEFIQIIHKESKLKTEVYAIWSKCSCSTIGEISWDNGWRRYVWSDRLVRLSDRCLFALGEFVKKCNENHKRKK